MSFSLQQFLPYLLNQAAEQSSLAFQKIYKDRYGMLRTEWRVVFHLGIYGDLTAKDIGERANIHKTKISRAVHKLEKRRFVSRVKVAKDRRSEIISLTAQGHIAYRDLLAEAEKYERNLLSELSQQEVAQLRALLQRLI